MSGAAALANSIRIPPRPEVLIEISREMESSHPDIDRIAAVLKRDVTLYAAILRLVNSPAFGQARNVVSIDRAIMLLGLMRVAQIVQVTTLQTQLGKVMQLNRFWDTAAEVAELMSSLAQQFTGLSTEDAYTVGMFHDFGVPLMMQAFPDYKTLLQQANQTPLSNLVAQETETYGFTHYDVGYELGKIWGVPNILNQAIRFQPQIDDVFADKIALDDSETIKTFLALLDMAKNISSTYRKFWRTQQDHSQLGVSVDSLAHLGLKDGEFTELREDFLHRLNHQHTR
ncbi:MAG: HDOD domain-containing protein [Spongiibacteraceae bacterium]